MIRLKKQELLRKLGIQEKVTMKTEDDYNEMDFEIGEGIPEFE